MPIVSRRKKKRIVDDDESVDLSLSPKAENEPSPEDDEIIGDEQLDDPFAGQEPFAPPPDEESVHEDAPVVPFGPGGQSSRAIPHGHRLELRDENGRPRVAVEVHLPDEDE